MTLDPVLAANRFGLGARPGELDRARVDARAWLEKQIVGARPLPDEIRRLPASAEVFKSYSELRRERNDAKSDSEAAKRLLGGLRAISTRWRRAIALQPRPKNRFASDWSISGPITSRSPPTSRRCSRSPERWRMKRSGRTSRAGSQTC